MWDVCRSYSLARCVPDSPTRRRGSGRLRQKNIGSPCPACLRIEGQLASCVVGHGNTGTSSSQEAPCSPHSSRAQEETPMAPRFVISRCQRLRNSDDRSRFRPFLLVSGSAWRLGFKMRILKHTILHGRRGSPFGSTSGTPNLSDLHTLQQFDSKLICWSLDSPLPREEYQTAVRRMRDSAAGDDDVTIGMWRAAGSGAQEALWEVVPYLWPHPPTDWDSEDHRFHALEQERPT